MRGIFGFVCAAFVLWLEYLLGNINTYVYPLIYIRIVHSEGIKIIIRIPSFGWNCVDKGVSRMFELREGVIEFIVVLEAG